MIDGPVLQDIEQYKTKNVMGFSAREFICLVSGGFIAIAIFFLLGGISEGWEIRALIAAIPASPILVMGFLRPFNQPFEKVAGSFIEDNIIAPNIRKKEIHYPEWEKTKVIPKDKKIKKSKTNKAIH